MTFKNNDVFVIDAVRTAFGRAGEKGIFWKTRAEDMSVEVLQALMKRNPQASPGPRLIAFMQGLFKKNPTARYGLTSMCVGRGQGYSMIWENMNRQ